MKSEKSKNTNYTFLVMATLGNTNLYFSFFIVHFSLKQVRCKSAPNPLQIPFLHGRHKDLTLSYPRSDEESAKRERAHPNSD